MLCQTLSDAGGPPGAVDSALGLGSALFFFFMGGSCFHFKVGVYLQLSPLVRRFHRGICLLLPTLLANECASVPSLYYTFTSTLEAVGELEMNQNIISRGCWMEEVHLETPT